MGGSAKARTSAGSFSSARPITPEAITLSTEHGRCGPCCSMAPQGSTMTVFSRSGSAAISVQLR
jgi:hypothetical protein